MKWCSIPHSFLAMTKPSEYSDESRLEVRPAPRQVPVRLSVRQDARVVRPRRRRALADHAGAHQGRPRVPADRPQHLLLVRARRPGVRRRVRGRRPGRRSSTSCRSCARPRARATPSATRRPSPASRARSSARSTRSTAPPSPTSGAAAPGDPDHFGAGRLRRGPRHHGDRRRPGRPVGRVLGRHAPGQRAGHRLAARARRPVHDAVSGEVDLRRARPPEGARQGPRGDAARAVARAVRRPGPPGDDRRADRATRTTASCCTPTAATCARAP